MTDIRFLLFFTSAGGDQKNTGFSDHGATSASGLPKLAGLQTG